MKAMLKCFELVSGLKVNFYKSSLTCIGVRDNVSQRFARWLSCCLMRIPFVYLGILTRGNLKKEPTWITILLKYSSKLAFWRHHALSFGSKVALIKYALSSLPLFFF